jgi:hypothetical protein
MDEAEGGSEVDQLIAHFEKMLKKKSAIVPSIPDPQTKKQTHRKRNCRAELMINLIILLCVKNRI